MDIEPEEPFMLTDEEEKKLREIMQDALDGKMLPLDNSKGGYCAECEGSNG